MAKNKLQDYREYIEKIFLQEPDIYAYDSSIKGLPPVASFNYSSVPENGFLTSLTYGISEYQNPSWEFGKPELILSVQSSDFNWGKALAFIGANMLDKYNFNYGEIIYFDNPISNESQMNTFFVFAPAILEADDYSNIKIDDTTINLVGLYPIYEDEVKTIQKIGLEDFMKNPDYDMYSINRKKII